MKISQAFCAGLLCAAGLVGGTALAAPPRSAVDQPAMMSAKASQSLLLDLAHAGKRIVAVGDRGHIIFSDDEGKNWTQARVPVSVMLTGVYFPTAREGWAVGHDGVILHSADAGATWRLQHANGDANGLKAGTPLLGVWFANNQTGYAVGAYGYFLATRDGGVTWTDNSAAINNPDGWHLNAIREIPGTSTVFIAGEHGKLFRSTDAGATWHALTSPFDGSFFGVAPISSGMVLICGLQGRVYNSADEGNTWQLVQTGVTSGLNAGVRLENGHVVVVGNSGVLLSAKDDSLNFIPHTRSDRQSIEAVLPLSGGRLLTAGEGGVKVLPSDQ